MGASSNWASRGIVGRGVLIDYYSWASENDIKYDTTGSHPISLDQITKIAQEKSITIHPGDILFLRTGKTSDPALSPRIRLTMVSLQGYVNGYSNLNASEREALASKREFPGIGQSRETTMWLWEKQFAAVAADSPAFENFRMSLLS